MVVLILVVYFVPSFLMKTIGVCLNLDIVYINDYILKASGDSMVDAGIEDGDMVVIRKQQEAHVGDIVVALDETGSNTLKRYDGIDPDSHYVVLLYQNQEKYPNKRILVKELTVQGIAQHVIKAL